MLKRFTLAVLSAFKTVPSALCDRGIKLRDDIHFFGSAHVAFKSMSGCANRISFIAASISSFFKFGFKIPIPSLLGALVVLRVVLAVIFSDVVDDVDEVFFVVGFVGAFLDSHKNLTVRFNK